MTTLTHGQIPMVQRADTVAGPRQGLWTYEAYAALPYTELRYEIIDGVLYMAPAPHMAHQYTVRQLIAFLTVHVAWTGLGQVFGAPCDVVLPLIPAVTVQPDVVVILKANLGIITPSHIAGAPDLVIEVLSPGTAGYDRRVKQDAYARAGIREYWLADPDAHTIELLTVRDGVYESLGVFHGEATLPTDVVPGFPVQVAQFFAE